MRRDVARRTEHWLIQQGLPQLIAGYSFRTHVLPRMLPFLTAVVVVSLVVTIVLAGVGSGSAVLAVSSVTLVALLGLPWLLARMGVQVPRLSRTSATAVLVAYAATPVVLTLLLAAAYSRESTTLVLGREEATTIEGALNTGIVMATVFAATFGLSWFATAYGLIPLARRAVRHVVSDMRGSLQLQGRALPTLLFVTFFLFFTGELWQLMNHLAWSRLLLVLLLFAAVTVLATSARLRVEVDRVEQDLNPDRVAAACADTPLAGLATRAVPPPPPLFAQQETNLLLVLATRQLIQAAVVGLGLFIFFIVLGLIVVDEPIATTWIEIPPERTEWLPFFMPVALFRAAALLAGFGSMYFAITAMTQESYRREFFDPVIEDVERTLAVRAVYLSALERSPVKATSSPQRR
jgi:hypothetical protein